MSALEELMTFQGETEALAQIAGRLGWDQETMMPRGSARQRGADRGRRIPVWRGGRSHGAGQWAAVRHRVGVARGCSPAPS